MRIQGDLAGWEKSWYCWRTQEASCKTRLGRAISLPHCQEQPGMVPKARSQETSRETGVLVPLSVISFALMYSILMWHWELPLCLHESQVLRFTFLTFYVEKKISKYVFSSSLFHLGGGSKMIKGILPFESTPTMCYAVALGLITFRSWSVANVAAPLSARESVTGAPRLRDKIPPGLAPINYLSPD